MLRAMILFSQPDFSAPDEDQYCSVYHCGGLDSITTLKIGFEKGFQYGLYIRQSRMVSITLLP